MSTMRVADTEMFLIILKKFSWATVSYVGLTFGAEKSRPKVEILRHSKPNLTALFVRQSRKCWRLLFEFRSVEQCELLIRWCYYGRKVFAGNSLLRDDVLCDIIALSWRAAFLWIVTFSLISSRLCPSRFCRARCIPLWKRNALWELLLKGSAECF